MVYQINYTKGNNTYCLFDIEYYMEHSEYDKDKWLSEIHCLPRIEGITIFLKDKLKDENFDVSEFIWRSNQIEELRGLLYESYNNKPKTRNDAQVLHYQDFGKVLRGILDKYCEKYDLFLNVD